MLAVKNEKWLAKANKIHLLLDTRLIISMRFSPRAHAAPKIETLNEYLVETNSHKLYCVIFLNPITLSYLHSTFGMFFRASHFPARFSTVPGPQK